MSARLVLATAAATGRTAHTYTTELAVTRADGPANTYLEPVWVVTTTCTPPRPYGNTTRTYTTRADAVAHFEQSARNLAAITDQRLAAAAGAQLTLI